MQAGVGLVETAPPVDQAAMPANEDAGEGEGAMDALAASAAAIRHGGMPRKMSPTLPSAGSVIATDEELGGAPNEGMDVASSNFLSITNRGLSNQ